MIEKIKDLLYDLTDFALVIIIVVVMFSVLSIKITDSLSIDVLNVFHKDNEIEEIEIDNANNNAHKEIADIEIKPENPDNNINDSENISKAEDSSEDEADTKDENDSTDNKIDPPSNSNTEVTINIASGSTGYKIAKLLKENNLITDTKVFISRVEELNLGAKLRSGTFNLNTSQSLDDMIYIIAGKK